VLPHSALALSGFSGRLYKIACEEGEETGFSQSSEVGILPCVGIHPARETKRDFLKWSVSGPSPAEEKRDLFREKPGDYFVTGNLKCTGEYPGFCVIAGVVTVLRFLQRLQAASRVSL
jgi:hypothetical protein